MIRVGQVQGAFGILGAVKVLPLTDFEDRYETGSTLLLAGESREVEWSREGPHGLVVKLRGMDTRTMAEMHRGAYLEVEPEAVRALPTGSFYHHQLVGLEVYTASGEALGSIADVLERPANDVWVARRERIEQLIPATRGAVLEVDLERRRITVADWLLQVEEA